MSLPIILFAASSFITASTFSAITWLFADAVMFRFELKSAIKCFAFALLTIAFASNLASLLFQADFPLIAFWLKTAAFWLMFSAFALDEHSKLKFLVIILIASLFFAHGSLLLSIQSLIISITVLQIGYYTKHKDLILFMLGFFLITIAEFFNYLNGFGEFKNFKIAGDSMYIFAAIAFFYWLWSYLVIRFNLKHQ